MSICILLDTCTFRNDVHKTGDRLDVAAIRASKEGLSVSIADPAFAELVEQIMTGRLKFDRADTIRIEAILDESQPIFPGGRELAIAAGTLVAPPADIEERRLYYRAGWRLIRGGSTEEFYEYPPGTIKRVAPDCATALEATNDERARWIAFIEDMFKRLTAEKRHFSRRDIIRYIQSELNRNPAAGDPHNLVQDLDGAIHVLADFLNMRLNGNTPYNPMAEKRRGDTFDWLLLFALPVPAIVVTADGKFVNRFRATGSAQRHQVVTVTEFNERVRAGIVHELLPAEKSGRRPNRGRRSRPRLQKRIRGGAA